MYDIIIIGCGPAGMTAAIYAARSNKKVLIIEKETIGGQMASSPLIENYPGFTSISGSELANNMFEQVNNLDVDFELEEVIEIIDGEIKTVVTDCNVSSPIICLTVELTIISTFFFSFKLAAKIFSHVSLLRF